MKICPKCKAENVIDSGQFCHNCGSSLVDTNDLPDNHNIQPQDDELDFVVTEAADGTAPSILGMEEDELKRTESCSSSSREPEDTLEITPNANLLEDEAGEKHLASSGDSQSGPIGDSAPHLISQPEPPAESESPAGDEKQPEHESHGGNFKRLSKKEVVDIRKQLYGTSEYAESNKSQLPKPGRPPESNQVDSSGPPLKTGGAAALPGANEVRSIKDPAELPPVEKAPRVRGVAYFRKNFIQVAGNPHLHPGDEINISGRAYLLRPKKISKKVAIGAFAVILVAILIIIGAQFIGPTISGKGEIVGLILDEYGYPYLEGARVTIPGLQKTVLSNPQGFFRFELVPTGTYEIEYDLGGAYFGHGNVTVTGGQTTLMSFGDLEPVVAEKKKKVGNNTSSNRTAGAKRTGSSQTPSSTKSDDPASNKKTSSEYAKIKLQSNVPDARLLVDNQVLGAGNNTYSRIKSGMRTVTVSKAGYEDYTKRINLEPNETFTLKATLARVEKTSQQLSAEEWLSLGDDAAASRDYETAIDDYSKAINLSPGMPEAYAKRSQAYLNTNQTSPAVSDLIRLGEISRMQNMSSQAIRAFTSALTYDPRNLSAMVGRAGTKLDKGNYRPALTDYEDALRIDNSFYPALYGAGVCQFKLGNNKKAEKHFSMAYKIKTDDPYLYQYMMLNYLALDNIGKVRNTYAEYKIIASPAELAEIKSSSRFAPVIRLIKEEER
ncbi:MAG: tetratricopeptide repeat protein [Candidatus Zixiibacteriota bacterium]|nr:MAG: tetratricopeptide repeat protein [candidate division Zixibacteria bacterium]